MEDYYLIQSFLQCLCPCDARWQLSKFLAAYDTEKTKDIFKVSKGDLVSEDMESTSSKIAERRSALISSGKVASILVVEGTNATNISDSERIDGLIQRLSGVRHKHSY